MLLLTLFVFTYVKQNEKRAKLSRAVESADPKVAAAVIVEMMLDFEEDTAEIAADFIENEVGRFDWVNNWQVIRGREDPVAMVQAYLARYGLVANAQEIVNSIDQMAQDNPGRWK